MKLMTAVLVSVMLIASSVSAQTPSPSAPQSYPLLPYLLRSHDTVQQDLVAAAELMPEDKYAFKATPDTKPFGQIVAHIALSRFGSCSALLGAENPQKGVREEATRTKADAVALLKAAGEHCGTAFKQLTDSTLTEFVKVGANKNDVAKGVFLAGELMHGNEIYGTMAVYLRLQGLVPPSTARRQTTPAR